ncbi:U-box domain [Popillia japonica]|uniref:WD repeat, SAM and U-box domain-containing protein 1 n=1 Tax=Popillia japonica TaxID=7064 RepID=A0AAW1KVR5_POPJA
MVAMTLPCDHVKILQRLPAHTSDVTSCDFAPNFNLVTGSSDKTIKIWEWIPSKGYVQRDFSPLRGHKYGVTCVKVSPQGSMLATASVDGTAVLWNLHSGTKIYTMTQVNGDAIRVCRFAPDSSILATGGDNGAICFWDLIHRSLIRTLFNHEGTTLGLAFTPDAMYAISGCTLEILNVWSMQDVGDTTKDDLCEPVASQDNSHDLGVMCVDASPLITHEENNPMTKSYTIATSGNCEKIYIWKVTACTLPKHAAGRNQVSIEKTLTLRGHNSAVTCVRYNHNGSMLASSSLDKLVKIWSSDGACISTLAGHSRYVNCVSFSRDSNLVSSGSNDKSVILWDLTGTLNCDSELIKNQTHWSNMVQNSRLQEINVVRDAEASDNSVTLLERIDDIAEAAVNSCQFLNDTLLATGSSDKMVRLFTVDPTREGILEEMDGSPLEGHSYSVNHIEFSKDGLLLASSSLDGWTFLWNSHTGEKITALPENSAGVRVSKFSPDSNFILTAGDDEKGTVWNIRTKEKIGELEGHLDAITSAAYSPDGKIIATMSNNGDFRLWTESINIFTQDAAHDLGVQSCDFSQNLEPIPNVTTSDIQNYLLVTCGNDSMVKLWVISVQTNWGNYDYSRIRVKLWRTLQGHGGSVTCVRFSSSSEIVCSTATDRQARIWSVYSAECLHVLDHDSIVTTCSFSASCSMLAVGCLDKTLWIWKLPQQLVFQTAVANKLKCKIKAVMDWTVSDILKWLGEIGLAELSEYISNTTLDGEKLLTQSEEEICSGLNLDADKAEKLMKEIKWLKQMEFTQPSAWDKPDVPIDFLCPITHEIMREPVTISDGFTYEKRAITEWFMSGKFTSPMTNMVLANTEYKPNVELRNAIYSYLYEDN